ncbi:AIS_HP2_G0016520.mRNA.1.CDS.1 [Saccharomyces cerevisiae]|nr:AIS_HP2_G0016520.mRNA.1.CDS.1 [Saccharomyces cerevisiae]CAI6491117.1 AIS_HP2_G0016520.mRNA.1.CDS.1 [Saccharomyces cerevisiae]
MGRTTSGGIHGFVDDLEPKSSILDKVGDFITVNTKRHDEREDLNEQNDELDNQENRDGDANENEQDELALDDLDRAFELVEGMDMDWMMPSHAHHSSATTATIKPRLLYSPLIHTQNAVPVTISPNLVATTTSTATGTNTSTSTSANKITKNKSNSSPYLNKRRGKAGPDSATSLFELPDSVIPTPNPKPKQYPKVILPSNSTRRISSATTKTASSSSEGVVVASESPVIAPHGCSGMRPLSRRRSSGLLVDDDKRESHKHAEQARRNRLAVALHELAFLIPAEWKQQNVSAAPSKATTVEAACRYIRHLQRHGST